MTPETREPSPGEKARTLRMTARYLGLKGDGWRNPETGMEGLLERAYALALEQGAFKHCLVRCPVKVEGPWVSFGSLAPVSSRHLARLLAGCGQGYALLATLGMGLDLAIRRLMLTDAALAVALGACGSALIDVEIDGLLRREQGPLAAEGAYLTPRFSPGYGDAPLSMQPGLLLVCGGMGLGVRLTQANLMTPEKSVSAVMGITRRQSAACPQGCATCEKYDCPYREEEV